MLDHPHYPTLRTTTPPAVRETVWWWYKNNRELKYNRQDSERVVYYKGYIYIYGRSHGVGDCFNKPTFQIHNQAKSCQPAKPASPYGEPVPAARICYYSFKASSPWQFTTNMAANCSNTKNEESNEKITSSNGNTEFCMCGLWNIWQNRYFNTSVLLKMQVSCVVTPFRLVNTYRHFEGLQSVDLYWQSVPKIDCLTL